MPIYNKARIANFSDRIRKMDLEQLQEFRRIISISNARDEDKKMLFNECDEREKFLLSINQRFKEAGCVDGDIQDIVD